MFCIGFLSVCALSRPIESPLWSGGAYLTLHQPTYRSLAASVGAGVADSFALPRGGSGGPVFPVMRLCRTAHSLWWAPGFGMVSLKSCDCLEYHVRIHF